MNELPCMIVLDADSNIRFFCPEAMARAIAAQPGAIVTQDNDTGLVVQIDTLVQLDLH